MRSALGCSGGHRFRASPPPRAQTQERDLYSEASPPIPLSCGGSRRVSAAAVADPHALAILAALARPRARIAIVSNTPWVSSGEKWRIELARHGLLPPVDVAVFCVDAGYREPQLGPQ